MIKKYFYITMVMFLVHVSIKAMLPVVPVINNPTINADEPQAGAPQPAQPIRPWTVMFMVGVPANQVPEELELRLQQITEPFNGVIQELKFRKDRWRRIIFYEPVDIPALFESYKNVEGAFNVHVEGAHAFRPLE